MKNHSGFTLVELITVVILLGTLSAIALPRFFSQSTFDDFFNQTEFQNALNWTRNKALTSQCAHEMRISSTGWMVLRDDDRDGSIADSDCSSLDNAGNGCTATEFFSFIYRDADDIVVDASQSALTGDDISSAVVHRLIFTAGGQLYDLSSLPTDLTTGCTDLSAATPIANNSTITLDQITLSADGGTAYVAIQ